MAQGNRRSLSESTRFLALALALAATGAWGMGDAPQENREAPVVQQGACPEAKAGGKAVIVSRDWRRDGELPG